MAPSEVAPMTSGQKNLQTQSEFFPARQGICHTEAVVRNAPTIQMNEASNLLEPRPQTTVTVSAANTVFLV